MKKRPAAKVRRPWVKRTNRVRPIRKRNGNEMSSKAMRLKCRCQGQMASSAAANRPTQGLKIARPAKKMAMIPPMPNRAAGKRVVNSSRPKSRVSTAPV